MIFCQLQYLELLVVCHKIECIQLYIKIVFYNLLKKPQSIENHATTSIYNKNI